MLRSTLPKIKWPVVWLLFSHHLLYVFSVDESPGDVRRRILDGSSDPQGTY